MSILSKLISRAQGQKPESVSTSPVEEKLENQTDAERLAEQKEHLAELSGDEQKAWVPTGDIETQRDVDEEERPSK